MQGAGSEVQGAGSEVQGAGSEVQGVAFGAYAQNISSRKKYNLKLKERLL